MNKYLVAGLMSGTSLDGLDIAVVEFRSNGNKWEFDLLDSITEPYESDMEDQLRRAHLLDGMELQRLDHTLGKLYGAKLQAFLTKTGLKPSLIASHGHTIFHQPEEGITLQIGSGYQIMQQTGIRTVLDFRSLDVALGGEGAPLVPIGDRLLFGDYSFCLNLGGFSNISFEHDGNRVAFDICPVNTVLNRLSNQLDMRYDANGAVSRTGLLNEAIFKALNGLPYYDLAPPKSLGIEWVHEHIFPLLKEESSQNLLHTFSHHIAFQIASVIKSAANGNRSSKLLVTGGGAKNGFLIELLTEYVGNQIEVVVPDENIIDFKESIIFALLGLLRSLGQINTLASVTGASRDSSGGLIIEI